MKALRLAAIAAVVVWVLTHTTDYGYGAARLLVWGVPMFVLMGAIVLGRDVIPHAFEKSVAMLGDASYSIYLFHAIVFVVVQHSGLHLPGLAGFMATWAFLVVSSIGLSVAINRFVEQPLTGYLRQSRLFRAPARSADSPAT